MKKIFVFSICMLLIALVIPTSTADAERHTSPKDDIEISISAGFHGRDIGLGFTIEILNHKTEDETVFINITVDYLIINKFDFTYGFNLTASPEAPCFIYFSSFVGALDGIKFISITAESGDTIISKSGLSLRRLVILS